MRILFVTATRVGDAVLSCGLLAHLLGRYPGARVTVACGPAAAGLFAAVPGLERLVVVEKQRFDAHWPRLWGAVAGTRWDLVVDLRGSALSFFLWARRRAVMRGGRRAGHRLNHLGGVLGLDPAPVPAVFTSAADEALAARLLPAGGTLIGLGPTANWAGKVWPAARFVALYRAIAERVPGARAVVFAGPGEAEAAMAAPVLEGVVLAGVPEAIDLVGTLTLGQAAACLRRVDLFVGNDSGLMHLAAAAGAATLGLFGPSRAEEYAPVGRRAAAVAAEGMAGEAPMAALSVDAALAAAWPLLALARHAA